MSAKVGSAGFRCRKCNSALVQGRNWTEGLIKRKDYICSDCKNSYQRQYYEENKDKLNELQRERYYDRREDILERQKERFINKKYGISKEEYENAMSGSCEICGKSDDLVIDHDHESGKMRGVLCRQCNMGIGLLGDSLEGIQTAIEYLKK